MNADTDPFSGGENVAGGSNQFNFAGAPNVMQAEDEALNLEYHYEEETTNSRPKRAKNFSEQEDILLVKCYLEVSFDPVVGINQTRTTLWEKIYALYVQHARPGQERNQNSLCHRWSFIQDCVNKFCGTYAQVEGLRRSGTTEEDTVREAGILYKETYKKSFTLHHCWDIMKLKPKWRSQGRTVRPNRTSTGTQSSSVPLHDIAGTRTSTLNELDISSSSGTAARPVGRKAEKKRQRAGEPIEECQKVLEELSTGRKETNASRQARHEETMKAMAARHDDNMRLETERLKLKREKLQMEALREDERIMTLDLSKMDDDTKDFYMELRRQIIQKRRQA